MTTEIEIGQLRDRPQFTEQVVALGDRFKRKLGLFPLEALEESARNGTVLIATEGEHLLGYLLFRVSRRHPPRATITHLCVEPEHRGQGIARRLVNELVHLTQGLDGIRLSCRRDYEENGLWPRLGFRLLGEKRGNSKAGTPLNIWWFGHGSPLLERMADLTAETRVVAAIDANVVFDLQSDGPAAVESEALLSDWLQEHVWFVVTPELNNEINRQEDLQTRIRSRACAERFFAREGERNAFETAQVALRELLGTPKSESEDSDIRQIAWAVAGSAEYFVTRDARLLDAATAIEEALAISVVRPSVIITRFDEIINSAAYQPRRFEGSLLSLRPAEASGENRLIENYLDFAASEKRGPFVRVLREALASSPGSVQEILDGEQAEILYQLENLPDRTRIRLLRAAKGPLAPTVLRQLLSSLPLRAGVPVEVTEPQISMTVAQALVDSRFFKLESRWLKPSLRYVDSASRVIEALRAALVEPALIEHARTELGSGQPERVLELERALAPAKFSDLELPCYIVPIQPFWAAQLFDTRLAEQDLFGLPPELGFRLENVYYRSARGGLQAPARLLWYVSQGDASYAGSMAIRAASYLDEVRVEPPKPLFSRYRRLGVYRWEDVLATAKGEIDEHVMALRFSGTELLDRPVQWADLQASLESHLGRRNQLQSPVQITSELFFELYSRSTAPAAAPPAS